MKPTTEQILSALNEMLQSKTELKAEKVELGLVDDLDKLVKKMSQGEGDMDKQLKKTDKEIFAAKSDLRDVGSKYNKTVGEMSNKLQDFQKAAKELGVKVNVPKYDSAIKSFIEVKGKVSDYLSKI